MRYSFYQSFGEDGNVFKLYIESQMLSVRCYKFETNVKSISNEPGITRLFGQEIFDMIGNYFLYPLEYKDVEIGDFIVLEDNEKVLRIKFPEIDGKLLQGEWIIRRLSSGDVLLWKPLPVVFTMPTKNVIVNSENKSEIRNVKQQFSIFQISSDGEDFEGIAAAEGIWTGQDLHTTLFTDKIIESIFEQMNNSLDNQLVDYNHDFINDGKLTNISLETANGIKYIRVWGKGNKPIPMGAGLSMILNSSIIWDKNLNVFILLDAKPEGVSIMTSGHSACTICMIK